MQVRFSTCRGQPVADADGDVLGSVQDLLLNPDTGRVEGLFVAIPGFLRSDTAFLSSADIRRWGTAVELADADALGPLDEHVRLERLAADPRRMLGQPMVTEAGASLGRCADVQFDTESFHLQWLFPRRRLWRWGIPVPAHAVLEVRPDAIVVRSQAAAEPAEAMLGELAIAPPAPAAS